MVKSVEALSHEEKQKDGHVQPGKENAQMRTQKLSLNVWENDSKWSLYGWGVGRVRGFFKFSMEPWTCTHGSHRVGGSVGYS